MERAEKAREYFKQGYACSQAVALAFADLTAWSEDEIKKATLPFAAGLGRLRLTCGAVSGAAFVIGALLAKAENSPENKLNAYAITREFCEKFQAEHGSLICADLLTGANLKAEKGGVPEARTAEYYKKRPCDEIVFTAAEILEAILVEKGAL